jgi:hypothetical protein
MKIIKNTQNGLESIVGEMINITYGMTIYKDGVLLEDFIKNHNEYIIDDVSYKIHPNIGILILLSNKDFNLSMITNKFYHMTSNLLGKIDLANIEVGSIDTRNNMLIVDSTKNPYTAVGFEFNKLLSSIWSAPLRNKITWCIYNRDLINVLPIIGWNAHDSEYNILSLSSIIYDDLNCFNLNNNYKSPDYPNIKNCHIFNRGNIYDKKIYYNLESGPLLEIARYYNQSIKNIKYINKIKNKILHYAKWEQLIIYESNNDFISWEQQIKLGLLDSVKEDNKTIFENSNNNKIYKCFVTGVPIYEDCYVFDICSIKIEETIDINHLHKYPNAIVISDDNTTSSARQSATSRAANTAANTAANRATSRAANRATSRKAANPVKNNRSTNKTKDNATMSGLIQIEHQENDLESEHKSMETKEEPTVQYVKIKYTHIFTTPKCLLISPWYMHFANKKSYSFDPVSYFENTTNTKLLVYRSYCPTKAEQIIESLNTTDLHKKILKELDQEINCTGNDYYTKSCVIKPRGLTTQSLLINNSNLIELDGKEIRY